MSYVTAYNPSATPVVVSERGHTIGGNDWGTVSTTDDVAKALLDDDRLVVVEPADTDADELGSAAGAAAERTTTLTERRERVEALTKPKAVTVAREAGLVAPDADDPLRADLDVMLIEALNVDIPAPSAVKKTASTSTSTTEPSTGDTK